MFELEKTLSESENVNPARIFFSVGVLEEPPGDEELAPFRMVTNLEGIVSILGTRNYPWTYEAKYFAGEIHTSAYLPAISKGLRYLYRGWQE